MATSKSSLARSYSNSAAASSDHFGQEPEILFARRGCCSAHLRCRSTFYCLLLLILVFGQPVLATTKQTQWQGRIYEKINGPTAEQVWPFLEDFCNIYKIFPVDVSFCIEGVPGHTGQHRYMAFEDKLPSDGNKTFISWEKHNLVELDPINRYLTYEMMENNILVTMYRSTMTVEKHKNGSQLKWQYIANPVEGYTSEIFRSRLQWILQTAAKNIEKAFQST